MISFWGNPLRRKHQSSLWVMLFIWWEGCPVYKSESRGSPSPGTGLKVWDERWVRLGTVLETHDQILIKFNAFPHSIHQSSNNIIMVTLKSVMSIREESDRVITTLSRSFEPQHVSEAGITLIDTSTSNIHWVSLNFQLHDTLIPGTRQRKVLEPLFYLWESKLSCKIDQGNQMPGLPRLQTS